jgi:hypothetical protein
MAEDPNRPSVTAHSNSNPTVDGNYPSRGESVRQTIERVVAEKKAEAMATAEPLLSPPSGHHSAPSDGTTTGRTLDYIGLAFILVPPEPIVAALVRSEPIHWEIALPLLFGCWAVGAFVLRAGLTWPKWRPTNERFAATISSVTQNIWVWLAFLIALAFGPTILYSSLSPHAPAELRAKAAPEMICTDGPCAPVHLKQAPEYFKEIGLGVGGPDPLTLLGTSVVTGERLLVAVDYSEYRSGWMPKERAFIGEIKEPLKGKREQLQLVYYASKESAGPNKLWWGTPSQNHPLSASTFNGSPIPAIIVRCRVAISGPKGEQHYYFILVRGGENIGTQIGIIPQYDAGDWIESWEKD